CPPPEPAAGAAPQAGAGAGEPPLAFSELESAPPLREAAAVEEEDAAVILYTSGTTGRPKGAMLTHLNVVHSAAHFVSCMGIAASDRSLLAVPTSHVTGLLTNIPSSEAASAALGAMP